MMLPVHSSWRPVASNIVCGANDNGDGASDVAGPTSLGQMLHLTVTVTMKANVTRMPVMFSPPHGRWCWQQRWVQMRVMTMLLVFRGWLRALFVVLLPLLRPCIRRAMVTTCRGRVCLGLGHTTGPLRVALILLCSSFSLLRRQCQLESQCR